MQSFFDSVLNWAPRKGTHTAAKLPADAEAKCEECFFHLIYIIKWYDVPPKVRYNTGRIHCSLTIYFVAHCWIQSDWKLCPPQQQDHICQAGLSSGQHCGKR